MRGGGRWFDGWFPGRFGCNRCTPWLGQLHPVGVLVAGRSRRGVHLLHLAGRVIHRLAASGRGVRRLHAVRLIGRAGPWSRAWRQGRELAFQLRGVGLSKVITDHAMIQVRALRPPVGALDPRRDDVRVAG